MEETKSYTTKLNQAEETIKELQKNRRFIFY